MSEFWIQTFTGKKFDLLEPTEDMICIEDIAHHLSIENRFTGATEYPYSVGYHCLLVASKAPENIKLEALLHELEEAYYKDLSTPLKHLIGKAKIDKYIRNCLLAANNKFKLSNSIMLRDGNTYDTIKAIDTRMVVTERNLLMDKKIENWLWGYDKEEVIPYDDITIMKLEHDNVEKLFLDMYERYRRI